MQFTSIKIKNKIQETKDAVSLVFNSSEFPNDFPHFIPGQHLTLKLNINNTEYRRSYSISSIFQESDLKITIKRVKQGIVSNYIFNELKEGDSIEISKPEGHFCLHPDPEKRHNYYFFAAGSGITPIYSMIQSILEFEPKSTLQLFYGNRNEEDIIFHKELEALKLKYEGQVFIEYTLSQLKTSILPFLSKANKKWAGWKGRINDQSISKFLGHFPTRNISSYYYLCGPGEFIENAKSSLLNNKIDAKSIHAEYFTTPTSSVSIKPIQNLETVSLIVHLNHKTHELKIPGNKKILDSLLDAKLDPPFSCSSGACSTCIAKLIKGQVHMDVSLALEPEEIEQGYILTCQSRPLTAEIEIKY